MFNLDIFAIAQNFISEYINHSLNAFMLDLFLRFSKYSKTFHNKKLIALLILLATYQLFSNQSKSWCFFY